MGKIESDLRIRVRNTRIRYAILTTIQIAGLLTVAAAAPRTLSILGKTLTKANQSGVRNAASRLVRAGLLTVESNDGKRYLRLTTDGEKFLSKLTHVPQPRKWDRKWRLVTFDISERRKILRNRLRDKLRNLGFIKLQDSMWVFPFDCEDLVTLLKADYRLGREVLYIIADHIENDARLRVHFDLPKSIR